MWVDRGTVIRHAAGFEGAFSALSQAIFSLPVTMIEATILRLLVSSVGGAAALSSRLVAASLAAIDVAAVARSAQVECGAAAAA